MNLTILQWAGLPIKGRIYILEEDDKDNLQGEKK